MDHGPLISLLWHRTIYQNQAHLCPNYQSLHLLSLVVLVMPLAMVEHPLLIWVLMPLSLLSIAHVASH